MSGDQNADQPTPPPSIPTPPDAVAAVPPPIDPQAAAPIPQPAIAPAASLPAENIVRGGLLALLAVPVGVIVFVLIWNLGFVSAIVGFGVAFAAFFLYRLGSGGRVSMPGAIIVTAVTVATLVLAFLVAMASDIARVSGDTLLGALFGPYLLPMIGANGLNALITVVFGVLGCFAVLRNAFQQARAQVQPVPSPAGPTPPPPA